VKYNHLVKIVLILIILLTSFSAFSECCVTCLDENDNNDVHSSRFVGDDCSQEDEGHKYPVDSSPQTLSCNCSCIPKMTLTLDKTLETREPVSFSLTHIDHNSLEEVNFHQIIFHPPIS
jgi:hypothetical protein